ncbi:unnamed protein product [Nippostrongylus brasiliensis]|uniref:Uncharacterized protein n=1 Tax=Nippostrongylus brasiliensis TaxID=27835 RepID=A0A0N4XY03_NIPBR|nr:unnamed protein product [Nippostrongylus brasiliensis]
MPSQPWSVEMEMKVSIVCSSRELRHQRVKRFGFGYNCCCCGGGMGMGLGMMPLFGGGCCGFPLFGGGCCGGGLFPRLF